MALKLFAWLPVYHIVMLTGLFAKLHGSFRRIAMSASAWRTQISELLPSNSAFFQNVSFRPSPGTFFESLTSTLTSFASGDNSGQAAAISIEIEVLSIPIHNNAMTSKCGNNEKVAQEAISYSLAITPHLWLWKQTLIDNVTNLTHWPILYFLPDSCETSCPPGQGLAFTPPMGSPPHIVSCCNDFPPANHSTLYVTFCHISIPLRMSTLQIKVTSSISSFSLYVISGWPRLSLENGSGGSIKKNNN